LSRTTTSTNEKHYHAKKGEEESNEEEEREEEEEEEEGIPLLTMLNLLDALEIFGLDFERVANHGKK
jgi:hypothetical protein